MTERESNLTIVERHVEGVTVMTLTGQMVLDDGDLLFWRHIRDLLHEGHVRILVNLDGVTFIDSSGVGMLVARLQTVREKGGAMKLVNGAGSRNQRLLSMLKLNVVFEIFEDEASALRSFMWPAKA